MRVIGGQYRSRLLVAPPGSGTRPTSDRLRETLFNVLATRVADARVADLYAGSGAVGIEALSRGAAWSHFVERAPAALQALRKNIATLGLGGQVTVEERAVAKALADLERQGKFSLIFLDPPYEAAEDYASTLSRIAQRHEALLAPEAIVIAEHAKRSPAAEHYGSLVRYRLLEQGDAALSFYSVRNGD